MAARLSLGEQQAAAKKQSALQSKSGVLSDDAAAKAWNEKSMKYQEQVYWLKLEFETAQKEKGAVEKRMAKLFSDMHQLKELSKDSSDLEALAQKHERTVSMLQTQIGLLRNTSNQVVASLKDEIRDLLKDKTKNEAELMNYITELEKQNAKLSSGTTLGADAEKRELLKEIAKLRQQKDEMAETLRKERAASSHTITALRQDKTVLTEQVEKMQGDLLVLRASVDTVHSIDQMVKDRDESMQALEQVGSLWDRVDSTLSRLESFMEPLMDDAETDDQQTALSAFEKAALLHGQSKIALMLVEMKLRNTLACLKNDSSQLAVAITDPGIVKQIEDAKSEALTELRQVADLFQKQFSELDVKDANVASKVKGAATLQAKQAKMEQDIQKMPLEDLCQTAKSHAAGSTSTDMELLVGRKILHRLQTEVLAIIEKLRDKNESIGRLEATVAEYTARERVLLSELKRFMKEHSMKVRNDRETIPLLKLLEQDHFGGGTGGDTDDEIEVEIVDEEEEIIEEEIIEEPARHGKPQLHATIVEEEEIVEEE